MDIEVIKKYFEEFETRILNGEELTEEDKQFVGANLGAIKNDEFLADKFSKLQGVYKSNQDKKMYEKYAGLREKAESSRGDKLNLIFLMGASASGKTVTGRAIANISGGQFHDFDDSLPWSLNPEWTPENGYTPGTEKFGEIYYKDIMTRIKKMVTEGVKNIVLCGFTSQEHLDQIRDEMGGEELVDMHKILLDCTKEEHERRMAKRVSDGQQLAPEHMRELEQYRTKAAQMGATHIDTTGNTPSEVAAEIIKQISDEKQKGIVKKKEHSVEAPIEKPADITESKQIKPLQSEKPKVEEFGS